MFRIRRQLRSNDFDTLGHLNQAVYHVLLEDARIAFVESRQLLDFPFVVVRTELDYQAEIPIGQTEIAAELELERLGNSSFTLAQRIWRLDDTLAAHGSATFVRWDPRNRRSQPLTGAEREALAAEA